MRYVDVEVTVYCSHFPRNSYFFPFGECRAHKANFQGSFVSVTRSVCRCACACALCVASNIVHRQCLCECAGAHSMQTNARPYAGSPSATCNISVEKPIEKLTTTIHHRRIDSHAESAMRNANNRLNCDFSSSINKIFLIFTRCTENSAEIRRFSGAFSANRGLQIFNSLCAGFDSGYNRSGNSSSSRL